MQTYSNTLKSVALTSFLLSTTALAPSVALAQDDAASERDIITVTARKQEENLQEVPVAVSVVSSAAIDNLALQDLSDIAKTTAGLSFDNEFGRNSNRPVIRGQANILGDSGVSYFIDGVYISGSIAGYDINDIERVEIVKGPQSALYGRNTYSGAINIITKSPGDEWSGRLQVEAAEDDQYEVSGTVKGPIIPGVLSAGLTARYYEFGGEYTNQFDGSSIGEEESMSFSGVVEWTPTDRLRARGRVYYSELDDGQPALFHQAASENNCFFDNGTLYGGDGRYFCGVVEPRDVSTDYSVQIGDNAGREIEDLQTSLVVDYDISDRLTLTSITGYNSTDEIDLTDGDYQPTSFQTAVFTPGGFPFGDINGVPLSISPTPFPPFTYAYVGDTVDFTFANESEVRDFSQELRLEYVDDRVHTILGAYYFDEKSESKDIRTLPAGATGIAAANFGAALAEQNALCNLNPICNSIIPLFGPTITVPRDTNDLDTQNIAVFGLFEYELTDKIGVTLEGRYAEEKIEQTAVVQDLGGPVENIVQAEETFTSFNPRITLDFKATDTNFFYVLAARGNKPGGFNGTVAIEAGLPTFDEEEVWSYEIGTKNVLADGQITLNLAAFFNEIEGYQLTQNARSGVNTTSATVNAGDAEIMGLEASFIARPAMWDGLTFTVNYAYTDSEFTEGTDQNQGVLNDVADNGLVDCSTGFQFPDIVDDCSTTDNPPVFGSIVGNQIPRTAEHQLFMDVDYVRPLLNDWEWFTGWNMSYESSKFAQVHNLAETGNTMLMDARLGVSNDRFTLRLWGKNLLDEDSTPLVLRYADGADTFKRSFVGTLRRGRHFGVTATANF
ncbi:MAG: TonB-dependent receptor [Pseudomonadota bacterium]